MINAFNHVATALKLKAHGFPIKRRLCVSSRSPKQ